MRWVVVLAGGSGTRFWPASTRERPKQLLALGTTDEPLLAATVRRLAPVAAPENVVIATGKHLVLGTSEVIPDVPEHNLLAEPMAKSTAPCIAWATLWILAKDPGATIGVFPADHAVGDETAFVETVERAYESAEAGRITTIGLVPTRPDTGFGYIEVGNKLSDTASRVLRFVEKPDRERAEAFVKSGRFLWNGGMFFFRATDMASELGTHLPEIKLAMQSAVETGDVHAAFHACPSISIDHGVMEKSSELAVVPGDFGWSDVGSWEAAWELAPKDTTGNAVDDDVLAIKSNNCLVRDLRTEKSNRVIALVGVDDIIVVETDGALLVMKRSAAQDVKLAAEAATKRR